MKTEKNLTDLITLDIIQFKSRQLCDNYTYNDNGTLLKFTSYDNGAIDIFIKHPCGYDFYFYNTITLEQLKIYICARKAKARNALKYYTDENTGEVFACASKVDALRLSLIIYKSLGLCNRPKIKKVGEY